MNAQGHARQLHVTARQVGVGRERIARSDDHHIVAARGKFAVKELRRERGAIRVRNPNVVVQDADAAGEWVRTEGGGLLTKKDRF
jgi:hypothetical protein